MVPQAADEPTFAARVVQLDNGLTVIHQQIDATPMVVADVWVKAGAIAEPAAWSGMAHFLEHMIFKGSEHLLPGQFDYAIESRGGVSNAATSHDYAHFFISVAAEQLKDTLPYLADLLLHAAIPADEFARERQVVLEEIRQAEDDPDWLGFQAMSAQVYRNHPYGRSVLGQAAGLNQRFPEEMRQFHRAHYQPQNMTVVIVGGIALEPTLEIVETAFRPFAQRLDCPQDAAVPPPRLNGISREILRLPRLEQGRLTMAWLGPGIDQLPQSYGLDLISVLLSEGRTSRLVRHLREETQQVQDIGTCFSLQRDCSLFSLQAWLAPNQIDAVEAYVLETLSNLATTPVSEAELTRAKRLLCNDYAFSTETPGQLAGLYGYYGILGDPRVCVQYPRQIQAINPGDVQRLAADLLSPEHYVATVLQPA